jgi:hypothetical protein
MRLLTDHVFLRALREYASRDFHPLSNDNYSRIQAFLEGFEAAMAPRAA